MVFCNCSIAPKSGSQKVACEVNSIDSEFGVTARTFEHANQHSGSTKGRTLLYRLSDYQIRTKYAVSWNLFVSVLWFWYQYQITGCRIIVFIWQAGINIWRNVGIIRNRYSYLYHMHIKLATLWGFVDRIRMRVESRRNIAVYNGNSIFCRRGRFCKKRI